MRPSGPAPPAQAADFRATAPLKLDRAGVCCRIGLGDKGNSGVDYRSVDCRIVIAWTSSGLSDRGLSDLLSDPLWRADDRVASRRQPL